MSSAVQPKEFLRGIRVLVVEDEEMIALALEDMLTDIGCEIVGPAFCLADAIRLASASSMDGGILDINLAGEKVYPVADILSARKIPFVFVTGYGVAGVRDSDRDKPVLQKPYRAARLTEIIKQWR
jgi:CheY-like chemotaxis protein